MPKDDDFADLPFDDFDNDQDEQNNHNEIEFDFPRFVINDELVKELKEEWDSGNYEKYAEQMVQRISKLYTLLQKKGFTSEQAFQFISAFGAYPST